MQDDSDDKITVENVNAPGRTARLDAGKYRNGVVEGRVWITDRGQ